MRTVVAYLRNAQRSEVEEFLTSKYPFQNGPPWICDVNGDACLYINLYPERACEFGEEEWAHLTGSLGFIPSQIVSADVSGRHPGLQQVREFLRGILHRFDGLAQDDYSDYCWTVDEVLSESNEGGRQFFDYREWEAEYNRQTS